ncbi:MAG: hypothetical protein V9G12_07735 [Microthrixaceae bacterium]
MSTFHSTTTPPTARAASWNAASTWTGSAQVPTAPSYTPMPGPIGMPVESASVARNATVSKSGSPLPTMSRSARSIMYATMLPSWTNLTVT